ncbi:MAG: HAMP domain-containing sensor histidine kinase [Vicinamibacterales bacterium]
MLTPSPLLRSLARVTALGAVAAVTTVALGSVLDRWHFGGPNDRAVVAHIAAEVNARFADTAQALDAHVVQTRAAVEPLRGATVDTSAVRELFRVLDRILESEPGGGITVFDAKGAPLAWSGRVSDLPRERVDGEASTFAVLDARGPRLVRVAPVVGGDRPSSARFVTVVVEQGVSGASAPSGLADRYVVATSIVDVALHPRQALPVARSPHAFAVVGAGTDPMAEGEVSPAAVAEARQRWLDGRRAALLGVLVIILLLCIAPILEWRRTLRSARPILMATLALVALGATALGLVLVAVAPLRADASFAPLALLPSGIAILALAWLLLDLMERGRLHLRRRPAAAVVTSTLVRTAGAYAVAAGAATTAIWWYERSLATIAEGVSVDLLRFSIHPVETQRLLVASTLIVMHAAIVWVAAALLRFPAVAWRTERSLATPVVAVSAAGLASLATAAILRAGQDVPLWPLLVAIALAGLCAAALSRPRGISRRASQSARIGALFLGLLLPSLALYPSVSARAAQAKERRVAAEYAPLAAGQRERLQANLPRALAAIDAVPSLAELVTSSSEDAAPTTDRAFLVWSQTDLALAGTTSAVELYGPNGGLVSWFALNLPEYGTTPFLGGSCDAWAPPYEETSSFGSRRRNVLRVSRAICDGNRRVGAVVVRVMLDYRSLPFISADNPYLESLRADRPAVSEAAFGQDIEFAVYGWSRSTLYSSREGVWPLAEDVFQRNVASRTPFWAPVTRDGAGFRVYFFNDRDGIYALGYPALSPLGHLVNLGELVFLVGVLYVALLVLATLANALTSHGPASGRALLREVRSSYYRKLFLAFVASAVVPIVVLALSAQRYFTAQYRANVEEAALKTAAVAQRLVEDYAALQQRGGADALDLVDDQVMVLVRRAIDQDVNLFDRSRLQATSERPLFASHLLPGRTPGRAYRAIALDRLPTSAEVEDIGGVPYLLAAAPVRTGGREGIVTVPQPLRSRDVEQQSDELNRRILSASVMFVLFASAIGYWMAERIADPVNRLSRATRRIARGDLDARIATTSSDELRRLVEDFNQMADDLKRQRADRERAQRLEAWADMARQVAHDIKNPLTPIQLSAEHARRVNLDRGSPLSPVLDECVSAILSQVRLLREIASEFSSFASSPTAHEEPADLVRLIDTVVEPYRAGLAAHLRINVEHTADLPVAWIDRTLVSRAITNLIENALHAMPGGGTLTIAARRDTADAARPVLLEVRDTGVGMDEDAMRRLFEPYFSTKATGTGLGLTIAKRNIELIGGTIAVESERGVGTTVTLRLRAAE